MRPAQPDPAVLALVLDACAFAYSIPVEAITGGRRTKAVSFARLTAYWILRNRFGWSYPSITRALGRANHTTAMCGVDRIDELRETDWRVSRGVLAVIAMVESRHAPKPTHHVCSACGQEVQRAA